MDDEYTEDAAHDHGDEVPEEAALEPEPPTRRAGRRTAPADLASRGSRASGHPRARAHQAGQGSPDRPDPLRARDHLLQRRHRRVLRGPGDARRSRRLGRGWDCCGRRGRWRRSYRTARDAARWWASPQARRLVRLAPSVAVSPSWTRCRSPRSAATPVVLARPSRPRALLPRGFATGYAQSRGRRRNLEPGLMNLT
jgi:hypothetical protein